MKMRNSALTTGAVATLAAFGLLAGVAGAQNTNPTPGPATDNSPHPVRLGGKVASVNAAANSLTLTTPKGSYTVTVGDKTWVLAEKDGKCAEGSLSDIKADQIVMVGGMTTTIANQVAARTVAQGACFAGKLGGGMGLGERGPGQGHSPGDVGGHKGEIMAQHMAMGAIKSVSGSVITLTSERGDEVTVNTTASTVVLNGGFKDASSLKVGDKIQVLGRPADKSANPPAQKPTEKPARTIEAWGVRVVTDNSKLIMAHVEKVDGNTVTLKTRHDTGIETATLDGSTGYRAANAMDRTITLTNAVQADVKVGSNVLIEGTPSADGKSIAAKSVVVLPAAPTKGNKTKP